MKPRKITKPGVALTATVIALFYSALAIAGDPLPLIGKDLDQNRDWVNSVMQGRNYMVEVDRQGKIKQIIDAGANGNGKDPGQDSKSAAHAKPAGLDVASADLPENYEGQGAVDYIGIDLPKVAAQYGLTPDKFKDMLLHDATIRVDVNKRLFYVDTAIEQQGQNPGIKASVVGATASGYSSTDPSVPIASTAALANAFKLHSKPGASKTIYLDFDGYVATKTAWSKTTISAPAYDLTGKTSVFDDTERSNIISIWNRVAEDYIPFDVDVTTEAPLNDALLRSSAADATYGTRVVITKTGTVKCTCGGVAYLGVVAMVNNTLYQPAWVFQQSLGNNEKNIAEAISHEAGHTLGLFHDGQAMGGTVNGYYTGHGDGATGWAPIMGVGYYRNLTQWNPGTYPGANNQQDDVSVFASNGILPRVDDIGNTLDTASSLTNTSLDSTAKIKTFGVIETVSDVDMYTINTLGGDLTLTASPAAAGPNLDIQLTLYNPDGSVLVSDAPVDSLSASVQANVPAGIYYLAVSGSGRPQTSATDFGYLNYGSLGQYQVTGSYPADSTVLPPTAVITPSTVTGPAPLTINFSASESVGNGSISSYQWTFGDGTVSTSPAPVHTYTTVGDFTVTLTVTDQFLLTNTVSVPVSVTVPPLPTLHASPMSISVAKSTKINGQVTMTVVDSKKRLVPNATVTGTWSGAFSGTTSSKTASNGVTTQKSNIITYVKGGSASYTLDSISAPGYTYDPTLNAKNVLTISW